MLEIRNCGLKTHQGYKDPDFGYRTKHIHLCQPGHQKDLALFGLPCEVEINDPPKFELQLNMERKVVPSSTVHKGSLQGTH